MKFIQLHELNDEILYVFKSGHSHFESNVLIVRKMLLTECGNSQRLSAPDFSGEI